MESHCCGSGELSGYCAVYVVVLVGDSARLLRESEGGLLVGKSMSDEVLRGTVRRWGYVCAVRALLPLAGSAVAVWGVLGW